MARLRTSSRTSSRSSVSFLEVDGFKGSFSFDDFFKKLASDVLPSLLDQEADEDDGGGASKGLSSGPTFSDAEKLLPLLKDTRRELVDLSQQVEKRLEKLKKEVAFHDSNHRKTLAELDKGVEGLFASFSRLDSRISGVGQTAARIGDHLQSADAQRETASQTIELIKYLMEFNSLGDLMELSPFFSDDSRVAEAAAIAQKLRAIAEGDVITAGQVIGITSAKGASNSRGLEVAVTNLQEYCNELQNRLLARFDAATQRKDLLTMAECAKISSQFDKGVNAMVRYVGSRPMFIDVEVMAADLKKLLGEDGSQLSASNLERRLSAVYKEIVETVRKESSVISAVFPNPDAAMSLLVQRVLEQRVSAILEQILPKPSLSYPPSMEEGGLIQYLRVLAVAYEKTLELSKELHAIGTGDFDVEGLADSLFSVHREEYAEMERASLNQLFQAKIGELRVSSPQIDAQASLNRTRVVASPPSHQPMSTSVVTEFVRWNEEAVQRCCVLTPQPIPLATNIREIFSCLLDQVSQYTTDGLERARESLNEAAALRERFVIGASVSRRVAAAAASAAEAAAAAGESSFRSFMVAVQRSTANVAMVQQHFVSTIARLLLPVEGAHAACCEEMAASMSNAEGAALKGLQQCIETVIVEVDRLLAAEQKLTDYCPPEDGNPPDHRPTNACTRVVAYLARMLDAANGALEGLNKQAFMTEMGNRLYKALLSHWQRFTFNPSGGLRLKRDATEYADFVRSFKAPAVDEKFETLGTLVNVFIVAPESLFTLIDGSLRGCRKEALRFIELRDDYKSAKIASRVSILLDDR
ncbi:hypothetical protein KP509_21G040200 [Ceratopteris richardii]|uniref:Exocyst complex component Sec10 n=1 Tax=Ceratopteris richardii TaxID=49495 RepID=A0A8T2SC84_CERRI|nr:hypothetical protein KP509_21G040200 [Ceratopteris richardii]